ncbi:LacI family DNA-binding transcriptional regulator [Clostridium butyricum]|uniref:LacI family DNA-binding transcriptional regulator n=1 Tax=Clostridium butyricum TaxID=1492 RepID=UPI0005EB3F87|nr:LacI family DNA-binding transcriptional regulator [Clostridium butyricum]ALP91582.1 LacI family transcriptional regulator [Clostridium butyricum]ALS18078.1 LacI family transcriptional regulator [Clostridium butyricum]ANF15203.1 LacI family transcriptional regulator [Clostridium butyricum]MCI3009436.1 LacI family transcriptional regulator [Clostridium butyricum]MDM8130061.1 LacI family DNA-binding transcriptional regulator [Clostridium butyricum]
MSTIYEIAKIAGVSPTTVSKVLNDYPDVSDKTRAKIKKILEEENFYPNSQAQNLSTKKTWTLGIVYFENLGVGLSHPFFSGVIEAFKNQADSHGYSLLFGSKNNRLGNDTFLEYFKYINVDGIAIICTDPRDKETLQLIESDFPIVVIDMFSSNTSTVTSDSAQGCRLAINYLYNLGHRKIAHIEGISKEDNWPSSIRKEYYIRAMKDLNLDVPDEYIVDGVNFDVSGGYEAMKKLLELEEMPTAVFASCDKLAIGAIDAIKEAGLSVPEDISIIGFDDIELAKYVTPKLTTIRQDCTSVGKAAVDLLVEQINAKAKLKINKVIPVELIERESCRKI